MSHTKTIAFLCTFIVFFLNSCFGQSQVHLSISTTPNQMNIAWVTPLEGATDGKEPIVQWSETSGSPYEYSASGYKQNYTYINENHDYHSGLLFNSTMKNLKASVQYFYRVGFQDKNQWSSEYSFFTSPVQQKNSNYQSIIGFTADMGVKLNSSRTVLGLKSKSVELVIHPGDVCYPDDDEDPYWGEHAWDIWGNMVQPLSANVPWMISPGSHELYNNNIAFNMRFNFPTGRY